MATLTLPRIVERPAQPYVAIREQATIPFGEVIDRILPELFESVESKGIQPVGPVFFKYNIIDMPRLEIEFGLPVETVGADDGRLIAGVLPAGRYAELTYWGHYDRLVDVTAMLLGWARQTGLAWDSYMAADGEYFAARLESYSTDPREEPDPDKWETVLAIKIRD